MAPIWLFVQFIQSMNKMRECLSKVKENPGFQLRLTDELFHGVWEIPEQIVLDDSYIEGKILHSSFLYPQKGLTVVFMKPRISLKKKNWSKIKLL